jgi:pimeloyl-ACP methyl ester carboxylesterase
MGTSATLDFHTEPFADAAKLRASFGGYESTFNQPARSAPTMLTRNDRTPTLLLFGPSDHVIYPDFNRMAATVFTHRIGPFLLRDCGHFVPWEAPGPLVSATRAFCGDLLAAIGRPAVSRG